MSEKSAEIHERKLWFDGPNLTADAIVIDPKHGQILLIQRRDTGQWALPGGFIDPDDTDSAQAAIREVAAHIHAAEARLATMVADFTADGHWNASGDWRSIAHWLIVKLGFVSLLVLGHAACGMLVLRVERRDAGSGTALAGYAVAAVSLTWMAAIAWLALQKPSL